MSRLASRNAWFIQLAPYNVANWEGKNFIALEYILPAQEPPALLQVNIFVIGATTFDFYYCELVDGEYINHDEQPALSNALLESYIKAIPVQSAITDFQAGELTDITTMLGFP